jgi:signal peptidase I
MTSDLKRPPGDTGRVAPSRRRSTLRFVRELVVIVVVALLISTGIKMFLARSFYIPSDSMSATLVRDDRVIVNQLVAGPFSLARGDVVVFSDPDNWLDSPPTASSGGIADVANTALGFVGLSAGNDDHLIKRIIGLPGDTVACCTESGALSVNGIPLNEPYAVIPAGQTRMALEEFDVTVPDGHLWVMGDNRYNSGDSAHHRNDPSGGFVPIDDVVGRAVAISWPIDRWMSLGNYPDTFRDVRDPE